ncbi:MAG: ornithine carbamoyltransferase [Halobacteria archaeon]
MAKPRHLLSVADLSAGELAALLDQASRERRYSGRRDILRGSTVALLFEKPSTRTRLSFEAAVAALGGHPVTLGPGDTQLSRGETLEDTARTVGRLARAVVARVHRHETLKTLARASPVPVINALSDREHPCQTLADLLTIRDRRRKLEGLKWAWVGDGNNVCHSSLLGAALSGMEMAVATPPGYEPDPKVVAAARRLGGRVALTRDPAEAARDADLLYTDVWVSMGQEAEAEARRRDLRPYALTPSLLSRARTDALVMHCLPAHRGEEIAEAVMDGPRSVVWDQVENRLHAQKALLAWLLKPA